MEACGGLLNLPPPLVRASVLERFPVRPRAVLLAKLRVGLHHRPVSSCQANRASDVGVGSRMLIARRLLDTNKCQDSPQHYL